MATIFRTLSLRRDKRGMSEILIRFKQGNLLDQRIKTNIFINVKYWKKAAIIIKDRIHTENTLYHIEAKKRLDEIENRLLEEFSNADKSFFPKGWAQEVVNRLIYPHRYITQSDSSDNSPKTQSIIDAYNEFLENHKLSKIRQTGNKVVIRTLGRFQIYNNIQLDLNNFTPDRLREFEDFLRQEYSLVDIPQYKNACKIFPEKRKILPRGQNTINDFLTKIRTMILWCAGQGKNPNNPFSKSGFKIEECKYGTPIYITIQERNQILNTDFSSAPKLELYRDIFVFQCLVGCRVGDLFTFTKGNIINKTLQYIPLKTKKSRTQTITVPLNSTALEILNKYNSIPHRLFPFTYVQEYNRALKQIFAQAGITRKVIVINPTTGENEIKPINEIASSHLARRTFIGNLYKQVKDPNLVGALSGHIEGSKAFARYREIDDEIKRELVNLL